MDSMSPLEAGGEVFQRAKTSSSLQPRNTIPRPMSEATEIFDTDFEDDSSDFEEEWSPKASFETDERRRSQTTISSYDEAPTPSSSQGGRPFEIRFRPVEGPKGPHLFRSSQSSSEFSFDYGLQMSPLLPKQAPLRTETAFSEDTVTPITQQREEDFSIAAALGQSVPLNNDPHSTVRAWSTQHVIDWMYASNIDGSVIECFVMHDVDGAVLLDLQFEDLKELDIVSFGKRHQVWSAICDLKGEQPNISPQPTPFEDTSRPCTSNSRRSPSRSRNACLSPVDGDATPIEHSRGKRRRGRKPKNLDVVTPAESVSIVAIEQLLPKPHKCDKGERCAKWRKQQRELKQLNEENGLGRFPISPMKGGRVFVHGDPGNAATADNMIPNVRKQQPMAEQHQQQFSLQSSADPFRPNSEAVPSVVASSDLLGPGQLPEFALHPDMLDQVDKRDPQDNVRQFLNFQHMHSPSPPLEDAPLSPTPPQRSYSDPIDRSASVPVKLDRNPMFPEQHYQPFPSLQTPQQMPPRQDVKSLPKLDIPRASSAAEQREPHGVASATSICRTATASPGQVYRIGTPASEMDVPLTAFPIDPVGRGDASQSVPPNMQYRQHPPIARSQSRAVRRPSAGLPAVKEGEVFSPASDNSSTSRPSLTSLHSHNSSKTSTSTSTSTSPEKNPLPGPIRDPAHHSPTTKHFGYGADCTHAGWMKKRKTHFLRHEWTDTHCRLTGTTLAMHDSAKLRAAPREPTLNVNDYSVACASVGSSSKLSAAMKALSLGKSGGGERKGGGGGGADGTAFAFQLVPCGREAAGGGGDGGGGSGAARKAHHFAVRTKDERIDWMREVMLAKAREQRREGFEVEVNGVQA